MMLAASNAMPLTRLNMPKAVPRSSAGAVSATSAASSPCVRPICRPHSATPIITVDDAIAERQHEIGKNQQCEADDENAEAAELSDSAPAGQAEAV